VDDGRSSRFVTSHFREHFCSSGPTCLLIDRVRAPMVFVGVIVPPVGETNRSERRPIRTLLRVDPASGLPLPRPVRVAAVDEIRIDLIARRSFLPWALPLSGLSGNARDVLRPVVRARVRARPRMPRHRPPASRVSRAPIRSWALRRSFPVERSSRRAAVGSMFFLPRAASSAAKSPALQRVVGPMPVRSGRAFDPPDRLPV
jgi:hypothetical protein